MFNLQKKYFSNCPLCKGEINPRRAQCKKCRVNIQERQNLIYFFISDISESKIFLEGKKLPINSNSPYFGQLCLYTNLLVIYNSKIEPLYKTVITPDMNSIKSVISRFEKLSNYI